MSVCVCSMLGREGVVCVCEREREGVQSAAEYRKGCGGGNATAIYVHTSTQSIHYIRAQGLIH